MYSGQGEGSTIRTGITGVRWWVWVAGALLLAMIGYWLLVRNSAARSASQASSAMGHQAVPVTVAPATQGEFSRYITALGSVTPYYTVTVKTRVDGQLDTVNFKEGQMVAEGELLAQVDPRPFQAALEQAQGQLAKDKASLAYARVTIERDQVLFNHNVISRDALDSQTSTLGQYEGAIETDQANIDTARLNLIYSHITSPLSGRIGLRLVDPGNIIHATDTTGIAVITQLQPIAVLFNIAGRRSAQSVEHSEDRADDDGSGLRSRHEEPARRRHAADPRQPDRSDHRHDSPQGLVPEYRQCAVSESVREREAAGRYRTARR